MDLIENIRHSLDIIVDQLVVIEDQKGAHAMMGSQLNASYEILRDTYEHLTGQPYTREGEQL
jgi:hypothetical protein